MMNVSSWSIRNPIPAILLFLLLTLSPPCSALPPAERLTSLSDSNLDLEPCSLDSELEVSR